MTKRLMLFMTYLFCMVSLVTAQVSRVTGSVTSEEDGQPVLGASVLVKGTTIGTVTDSNGKFTLTGIPSSAKTLVISYVGMKTKEVAIKSTVNVMLSSDSELLDEVLVVAFGEQKRSSFTGSASVVKSETLQKKQLTNVISGLQGQVAGLQMVNNSGDPTATPSMLIRGISSINAGTSPLIIVDGAPYEGGWNNLNPSDVESITVLKDAASNALYGARGANGVIMITTKKGSAGKAVVTLDAKWGANSRATQDYDYVTDPGQYYEMHYTALYNHYMRDNGMSAAEAHVKANQMLGGNTNEGGLGYMSYAVPDGQYLIGTNGKLNPNATLGNRYYYNGQVYTITPDDWMDETFRTSLRQEYNVNVTGGNEKSNFYASLGYLGNDGIVYNSDYQRYTARVKADFQAKKWLKVGANLNYAHSIDNEVSDGSTTLFDMVSSMAPIYPIYIRDGDGNIMTDEHGKLYDYGSYDNAGLYRPVLAQCNFLQENQLNTDRIISNTMTLNGYTDITPLKGLKITLNGTVTNTESHYTFTQQGFYGYGSTKYPNGYVYKSNYQTYTLNFQQIANYTFNVGLNNFNFMVGHESYDSKYQDLYADRTNMYSFFTSQDLNSAIEIELNGNSSSHYNTEGYFFRGMYNYDEKYYLSASYRRDASSRFHPDHRWGNFYSIGGAWILSKEKFMENAKWIDMLKLKASWGQQGNDAIGDYHYTDTYSIDNSNGEMALTLSSVGNENITWETNSNFNVGVEFELFKSRLNGSVEYFYRKTTDMLSFVNVPLSLGYAGSYDNIGDMSNQGIELDLTANLIRTKDFSWSVNLNATHFKNKLLKLNEDNKNATLEGYNGYVNGRYFYGEGLPLHTYRMRKYAGVNENGQSMWYKTDDEGNVSTTTSYSSATYYKVGCADPDLYGGFGTTVSYKGIDLSVTFNYSIGGKGYDSGYATLMANPSSGWTGNNYHKDLLNAWSETNTDSNIPRFQYAVDNNDLYSDGQSDRFLINASCLTLQNVNLGYTLPKNWIRKIGLSNLRIYVSGENLCYFSKRKGYDPRGSFTGSTSTTSYSPVRTITGGLTAQF